MNVAAGIGDVSLQRVSAQLACNTASKRDVLVIILEFHRQRESSAICSLVNNVEWA
jgi:hypothetical protein